MGNAEVTARMSTLLQATERKDELEKEVEEKAQYISSLEGAQAALCASLESIALQRPVFAPHEPRTSPAGVL